MLPMPDDMTLKPYYEDDLTYNYITGWNPNEYDIWSVWGYKLIPYNSIPYILPEPGERIGTYEPATVIVLPEQQHNLIGYWLPQTQKFYDALGEYQLDMILSIKAETWCVWKINDIWYGEGSGTFEYGKAYDLQVETGFDLQWQESEISEPFEKAETEIFSYTDQPDYEVIQIESIENGGNVIEIGVFQDGVCIGASKVEEFPLQLLAYTDEVNRSGGLSFELATGRGETKRIETVQRFNFEIGEYETTNLHAYQNQFTMIKLGKGGEVTPDEPSVLALSNYPNPFNPITTIFFSVTQNSNFVNLEVFNLKGQKIKQLVNGEFPAGEHSVVWDGTDESGKSVSSGIYLYRIKSGNQQLTRRMIMMK